MDASTHYLVERMLKDVQFLTEQGHLKDAQAGVIRGQLAPLLGTTDDDQWESVDAVATKLGASKVTLPSQATAKALPPSTVSAAQAQASTKKVPPPSPSPSPAAQSSQKDLVKALWAFEAAGGTDELKFASGDTIEVVERNDENWWTGKLNGKQGLFPANYVEPYSVPTPSPRNLPPAYNDTVASPPPEKKTYAPVQARWTSGSSAPPAAAPAAADAAATAPSGIGGRFGFGPSTSTSAGGPQQQQQQQPGSPQTEEEREKQEKLKKLGSKVGGAAAGGFGFGIGAGLASNLF